MKILFVLPEYYPHTGGGISVYYQHYIEALKPHCECIKVIVGSGYTQSAKKFNHNGIEVEYLDPVIYNNYAHKFSKFDLLPEYKNNIAAAWAMWQQSNSGDGFDIIECTDFGLGFIPWVIHHNKPVITRLHGSAGQIALHENDDYQSLATDMMTQAELALLPLCDRLITHSNTNCSFWQQLLPTNSVYYILPVYNSTFKQPVAYNQRDNIGLVTARIQKWKGPVELCTAVKQVQKPVAIKWVGRDMPYTASLTTSQYLNKTFPDVWGTSIIPVGFKSNDEIKALQETVKYGIIPSVWDMFNFTCLEFMAAGTPVICAEGAGVSALIEHGKNGFKYPANDVTALADCIHHINSLPQEKYDQIVQNGFDTITNRLSAQALFPVYLKHYNTVLTAFKPSKANIFLEGIYSPSAIIHPVGAVLDRQPLKKLIGYLYKRLISKFVSK